MAGAGWQALVDASGALVSIGTVVADVLPNGVTARPVTDSDATGFLAGTLAWNASTLSFVAPAPVTLIDRLTDIRNDQRLVTAWQNLTTTQQNTIKNALGLVLIDLLGPFRFRAPTDPATLTPVVAGPPPHG